jgi:hypothetical protein
MLAMQIRGEEEEVKYTLFHPLKLKASTEDKKKR